MENIHVLIIPSWYGDEYNKVRGIFFRDQAIALKNAGFTVGIISVQVSSIKDSIRERILYQKKLALEEGIPTLRIKTVGWFPKLYSAKKNVWKSIGLHAFRKYLKLYGKPDIIHAHSSVYGGFIALHIKKKFGIPYVVTEHTTAFHRGLFNKWELKTAKVVFNESSTNIAVSTQLHKEVENKIALNNIQWQIIPNMVSQRFFSQAKNKANKNETVVILTIGALVEKKGHRLLIEAYEIAFRGRQDVILKIAGDGPLKNNLTKLIDDKNLSEKVYLIGSISPAKVPEFMKNGDIFVLPSRYETFGVVIVEALSMGLPVIATKCGGPESIISDRKLGMLVEPNNPRVLAGAMQHMVETFHAYNPGLIHEIAMSRFSGETIAAKLEKVYSDILQ